MRNSEPCRQQKKTYSTPRLVDFGSIVVMTDGCLGICADGENGGQTWVMP